MRIKLFVLLLLLFKFSIASAQYDWKLSTDKEGIKVYTSTVSTSKVKAVKVECELKATPAQMVALLMDVKAGTEWLYHTKSCALIKQVSPSELYYYSEINLPWPAENRDFVAHLTVHRDAATKTITIDGPAVPGYVPVKDGVVRIGHSSGQWILKPIGDNVAITYILQVDPGGAIPAWLVNMFAAEGPLQSFRKLKEEIRKPVYRGVE